MSRSGSRSPRRESLVPYFTGLARITTAGLILVALGACEADTLYQDGEITGPSGLAPLSVALVDVDVNPRLEDRDEMRFTVRAVARPGSGGVGSLGIAARVLFPGVADPIPVELVELPLPDAPREVTQELSVRFSVLRQQLPGLTAPEGTQVEFSAFALHSSGTCVAAVAPEPQQLPCEQGAARVPLQTRAEAMAIVGVPGFTAPLPDRVTEVGDLVVHDGSRRAFISNRGGHTIEVLEVERPGGPGFRDSGFPVGSQPWGLNLTRNRDSLIVANSGGTNISFVSLSTLQERRLDVPRITLHNFRPGANPQTCVYEWRNYTDRPQFVAQDNAGRLLYSAASSQAAPTGTIRMAFVPLNGSALSARVLFPGAHGSAPVSEPPLESRGVTPLPGDSIDLNTWSWAIANVDSVSVQVVYQPPFAAVVCNITFYDHVPGSSPRQQIEVGPVRYEEIGDAMVTLFQRGSDVIAFPHFNWNLDDAILSSDTTYVAASGNHRFVAFGEGVRFPDARVTLWSSDQLLSRVDDMGDLMNNTSDRMTSIALNLEGNIGVVRGERAAYFFDETLRLKGTAATGLEGGLGSALTRLPDGRNVAVLGTAHQSIQIVELNNYRPIAEIPIRDNVIGALRVGAPRQAGNVMTIYAVTAGGVLVLDVPSSMVQ